MNSHLSLLGELFVWESGEKGEGGARILRPVQSDDFRLKSKEKQAYKIISKILTILTWQFKHAALKGTNASKERSCMLSHARTWH